jgi:2-dehydro-3-deoxyphosphogluconate aldolase / (4S)-4-hydroxy-2-oxoglutarate aldolase
MNTLTHILTHKIVAIIRGAKPEDVLRIVDALYEGGVRTVEVTLNSPNALGVIKNLVAKRGDKILVGAGTVLDATTAEAAIEAGAKFIISPIVDIETVKVTKRLGAVSIPGAYTATEIVLAYSNGADIIKVFPASIGAAYIKDLRGPLPHIPMMPTGGVQLENIVEFKKAGAVAYGIGSALVDSKQDVTDEYLKVLATKAKQFVDAVR